MPVAFTLFKDRDTKDVCVFRGDSEQRPTVSTGQFPEYKAVFVRRGIELRRFTASVDHEFLKGRFEGLTRRTATVSGGGMQVAIKRSSLFSDGWQFVYMSDTLKWSVTQLGGEWLLSNSSGQVIARFQRRSSWAGRRGVLYVMGHDRNLEALIVLSCEIVNRTVDSSEQAAATTVTAGDGD
ncbi:hypothetical protein LPJ61_004738 [Coemansia biformis]|uniref:Uncharacterized protein n=1 Tax=Coemansia biformis TaxID=1286918 RepID=A0A9W7YB94_9FUNG|nr:hypothetical protein LPJ61_004738 [Coemansia biformis]